MGTSLWNARSKWYTAELCKTTGAPENKNVKKATIVTIVFE